jgi:hypothetical protein
LSWVVQIVVLVTLVPLFHHQMQLSPSTLRKDPS